MALYDGFFDAEYNAETDKYDREYESGDFTGYLAQVIGSGVCVYNNENSFKVRMGDGAVIISPGYLFIQGYYLKNDADHSLTLPGTGTYAIAAHLSLGKRMIELEAVSVSSSYPDSLVLAIVNGTANTADDTRYNTDICGVIDSAGELSKKVEYAINYIDNEIEGKLASVQAEIDAQAEKMDAKIAEAQAIVDRIVPPPVGTIKFTAAQNVGSEWIRCDGSFINQSDYPDLVEALGRLTPGVDSVTELLQANKSEQMSNACLVGGTVWVYLAESKKLVGMTGTERKEIAVTGVDGLEVNPSVDIVLSVVDGAVYLAQNNAGQSRFILLECAPFTSNESSISMNALSLPYQQGIYSQYIIPSVTKIGSDARIAHTIKKAEKGTVNSSYGTDGTIQYTIWKPGSDSFSTQSAVFRKEDSWGLNADTQFDILTLCGFSAKNGNDMVVAVTKDGTSLASLYSVTQGVAGSYSEVQYKSTDKNTSKSFVKNTIPVCSPTECLLNVEITSRKPVIRYSVFGSSVPFGIKTAEEVSLPSRSRLFKESVVYATAQGLWFVFVGTGLLFAENLAEGSWGFLDTQNLIGVIQLYGCLNYDSATNSLYISGMDTAGTPKVVKLKLPDLYNYATDGAFLPSLASDGVPAYIKATDDGGGEPGGDYLTVTVLDPKNYSYNATTINFSTNAQVLFNDSPLVPGTYRRAISDLGTTFTVGLNVAENLFFDGVGQLNASVSVNGTPLLTLENAGKRTATLTTSDYIESGLTLQGIMAKSN